MGEPHWKPISGYGGEYEVSDDGAVRSRKTHHVRELALKHNRFTGYDYVNLHKNGKSVTRSIHRLVAEAFIPNPNGCPEVNHINEVKTDNRVSNLEWCDRAYNNNYSKHRRYKRVNALTPEGELIATFESRTIAANFLGVSKSCVTNAINGTNGSCCGFILQDARGN